LSAQPWYTVLIERRKAARWTAAPTSFPAGRHITQRGPRAKGCNACSPRRKGGSHQNNAELAPPTAVVASQGHTKSIRARRPAEAIASTRESASPPVTINGSIRIAWRYDPVSRRARGAEWPTMAESKKTRGVPPCRRHEQLAIHTLANRSPTISSKHCSMRPNRWEQSLM